MWFSTAAQCDPMDLPRLIDALPMLSTVRLLEAIAVLDGWPPDPRLGQAMQRFSLELPSPRARMLVERMAARNASSDGRLDADSTEQLASVHRALDRLAGFDSTRENEQELLARIRANPDDDQARLVYADVLTARGDPRGEFIVLQYLSPDERTRSHETREHQLVRAHWKDWLGPLADVVIRDRLIFDRGFLSGCRLSATRAEHIDTVFGQPDWCTVKDIDITGRYGDIGRRTFELILDPCFSSLRVLRGLEHIDELERLVTTGHERPIDTLHLITGRSRDGWQARTLRREEVRLPHLHTLFLSADTLPTLRWFLASAQGRLVRRCYVQPPHQTNIDHPWGNGRTRLRPADSAQWLALPGISHLEVEAGPVYRVPRWPSEAAVKRSPRWHLIADREHEGPWQLTVRMQYSPTLMDAVEEGLTAIGSVETLYVDRVPPDERPTVANRLVSSAKQVVVSG
jgi:uncharacterized protein (TIGR02996 family)